MIQTEQILEYIDGLLDPESEQALFDAMARQPELRSALRQFISISEAVRADREAYSPPAEVEQALFEGIGLPMGRPSGNLPRTGFLARFGTYGRKFLGIATSFVVGAFAAGSGVYLWMNNDGDQTNVANRTAVEATAPATLGSNATQPGAGGNTTDTRYGERSNGAAASGTAAELQGGAGANAPALASRSAASNGTSSDRTSSNAMGSNTTASNTASSNTIASNAASSNTTSSNAASSHRTSSNPDGSRSSSSLLSQRNGRDGVNSTRSSNGIDPSGVSTSRNDGTDRLSTDNGGVSIASGTNLAEGNGNDRNGLGIGGSMDQITMATPTQLRSSSAIPSGDAAREHEILLPHRAPEQLSTTSSSITPLGDAEEEDRNAFILEARGQVGQSLNMADANASDWMSRTSYAGGLHWRFNRNVAVVAEGGFESYDQTLIYPVDPDRGYYGLGDTVRVDQRPSYMWGAVGFRYYLGSLLSNNLETFAQTTIGGVSAGPIARFRLGASYDMGMNFGLSLGGEFSSLFYSFREQQMMSGRWGLTLGAEYVFR